MWPFIKKTKKFKLRIVSAWFSDESIQFEYSLNGGLSWKVIYRAEPPFLGLLKYDWNWKILTYRLSSSSTFEYEKEQFSSYEKIQEYEANERKRMEEGQKSIEEQRKRIQQEKINQMKKINQNL